MFEGINISTRLFKTGAFVVPNTDVVWMITFKAILLKLSNSGGNYKYKYCPWLMATLHCKSRVIYAFEKDIKVVEETCMLTIDIMPAILVYTFC